MQRFFALGLALLLGLAQVGSPGPARAGDNLIVVELFTSEACANCPPAEEMLRDLAGWPDILPLSLHVDYWDYTGWPDPFALKVNVERQMLYAARTDRRRLFTPLIVVGGYDLVEGFMPMKVVDHIERHRRARKVVSLDVTRTQDSFSLRARAEQRLPEGAVVAMVTFLPRVVSQIARGENAGLRAVHTNVVTGWYKLASWDGTAPLALRHKIPPGQGAAVLVQTGAQDMIVAAARIR